MDLKGRSVALYGRFQPGVRERLEREIGRRGGAVARDMIRRSDLLVVGAQAVALVDGGALSARLRAARERNVPILGERAFAAALSGSAADETATLPLATALAQTGLTRDDLDVLAAFDLIVVAGEACRFGDAGVIRTAAELVGQGRSLGEAVRILIRSRDLSPVGRRKIVLTDAGEAALRWDDGLTTLEGQGFLPLDEAHAGVDDLFEAATLAEAAGHLDEAARFFDMCARADKRDAVALYNYANIRMAQGEAGQAALAYQKALVRDPRLIEARYNLAQALEAAGKPDAAAAELVRVLADDPAYADAVFNLAQLRMKAGEMGEAKDLYERYLALDPPDSWAATARKAIALCSAPLSA
jgi:tetratricopeptide (TPR) repeat protein